jgi:hypothetical protein
VQTLRWFHRLVKESGMWLLVTLTSTIALLIITAIFTHA